MHVKYSVVVSLLLATALSGCLQAQRAASCRDYGVDGCKDNSSQNEVSGPALQRAQLDDQSWVQPLNECMATGAQRTECFERLPPDMLAEYEAWEAEHANMRRRQFEQRQRLETRPAFGVEQSDPDTGT